MAKSKKTAKKYVAYYRVSTKRQGESELGLDAQREMVKRYIDGNGEIIQEFVEVESGKKNKRQELLDATALCKVTGATLIVAKMDRLGRNASYLHKIRDDVKDLAIVDMPSIGILEFGFRATFAEYEGEQISKRTKDALAEKKRQGYKLGKPENLKSNTGRIKANGNRRKQAMTQDYNLIAKAFIEKNSGLSYRQLATMLNDYKIKTATGKQWTACNVRNVAIMFGLKKDSTNNKV